MCWEIKMTYERVWQYFHTLHVLISEHIPCAQFWSTIYTAKRVIMTACRGPIKGIICEAWQRLSHVNNSSSSAELTAVRLGITSVCCPLQCIGGEERCPRRCEVERRPATFRIQTQRKWETNRCPRSKSDQLVKSAKIVKVNVCFTSHNSVNITKIN